MIKKIVISRFNNIAAILQHNKIQEIILINDAYQVNDIYLGIVQKIFSSINAAFINLGNHGKSGFIHISDIKPLKKSRNVNRITEILSVNQLVIVQVIKEPTINKGPRLTANINLLGRYFVLMPLCNTICISQKIYDKNEREYLHALAILLKPATMGLLVRSSAQGIDEETLLEDFRSLKEQWSFIQKAAMSSSSPSLLYKDEDLIKKVVRDYYEDDIGKIIIDSEDGLRQVRYHLDQWRCITPVTKIKLQLYKKSECILDQFNIKQAILNALQPKINLSLGGYIFIETNEALTVIDVNSGSFNKSDNSKEAILRTNCYAASEIAYQLKIRNINGVIIVDFIDMQSQRDQLQLLEHFNKVLKLDNAKPQIVQLSELGLVELTRRRRGQSLSELFNDQNHQYFKRNIPVNKALDYNIFERHSIVNKNINSLFFDKVFTRSISINKIYIDSEKYRISIDKESVVNILGLRFNCIVPLILYSKIIE